MVDKKDIAAQIAGDRSRQSWRHWCRNVAIVKAKAGEKFSFFAIPRNPSPSLDLALELRDGVHGIRNTNLLKAYRDILEAAFAFFVDQGRPIPEDFGQRTICGAKGVPVFVFAADDPDLDCGSPCMEELWFHDANGISSVALLVLPSRSHLPDWESELKQARSTAIHELSHWFNAVTLPWQRWNSNIDKGEEADTAWLETWMWFDEGMAVASEAGFAEGEARKSGGLTLLGDWVRYGLDWVDRPERPLDAANARYQAAFFVRYLERRMGIGFPARVWQRSGSVWNEVENERESALAAVDEELKASGLDFCSGEHDDVFASGYCFDSYFVNWHQSKVFEPDVFQRFTNRAITRTWDLVEGAPWPMSAEDYVLSPLGCRYFRFYPGEEAATLDVVVEVTGSSPVKIEMAKAENIGGDSRNGVRPVAGVERLRGRRIASSNGGCYKLTCKLPVFAMGACDHVVLVVTNCGGVPGIGEIPTRDWSEVVTFKIGAKAQR